MATRGRIGIQLSDGSVLSSYHHWDSYPEWLGRILKTHYNSKELAAELIDGGDMSSAWTGSIRYSEEERTDEYNYYGPEPYSARGENCPPRLDADLCEYLLAVNAEEYHYLFRSGEWVCYEMNPLGNELPKLIEIPSAAMAV